MLRGIPRGTSHTWGCSSQMQGQTQALVAGFHKASPKGLIFSVCDGDFPIGATKYMGHLRVVLVLCKHAIHNLTKRHHHLKLAIWQHQNRWITLRGCIRGLLLI